MATVLLIGTLDTKGRENQFIRDRFAAEGIPTLLMDVSCGRCGLPSAGDISCQEVAEAASLDFPSVSRMERLPAQKAIIQGAVKIAERLFREGRFQAIMALGGSNGTAIACAVMQRFPYGMPKLMVSTMASGDVRGYVGCKDIAMFNAVGDISLNRMTRRIFSNAVRAMAGMLKPGQEEQRSNRLQVAISVFGVVQPCVERAQSLLEAKGYDSIVFHTTGTGGMALEELIGQGEIDAVLDISTTEVADEAVGGVLTAGPHRLEAAGRMGLPQVIAPGAIDLINFGSPETVPAKWQDRIFYRHTPHITLMRTNVEESAALGTVFARKINRAKGRALALIPRGGFSAYDHPQGPPAMSLQGGPAPRRWFWPEADEAFCKALKGELDPGKFSYRELPHHINDAVFAETAVQELDEMIRSGPKRPCGEAGDGVAKA